MSSTRSFKAWAKPATALAVVLGLGLTMASPASAAPGDTSSSFGVAAGGLINLSPVAPSAFVSGLSSNFLANVSVGTPPLVSTGIINTTATNAGSSAVVNSTNVRLASGTTLTAGIVSSSCTVDPTSGAVSGDSSIVNGAVNLPVVGPTTLDANASPNTTLSVPGVATIILNRQITAADGTLTVDAIYISLLGSAQTVTIASSSCTPGTVLGVSMLPMSSAVGASLLGLSGLGFFIVRRRQTQQSRIEG